MTSPAQALAGRAADARVWLFEHAFPVWWERGFDREASCFHEKIGQDGRPDGASPRRIRVQARQTFAYAVAGQLGWDGPWREAVSAGCDVLLSHGLAPDGGTHHSLDAGGQIKDARRDLYDLAFVTFALAYGARALPNRADELITAAERLVTWAETHWAHPDGGFLEGDITPTPPRRQNPHMHMLEAMLAVHAVTGDARWLQRSNRIGVLFRDRFFARPLGVLPEYFDDAWRPLPGDEGRIVEPGHHFEWCWLLDQLQRAGGMDLSVEAERLRVYGEAHGVDAACGFTIDEVFDAGEARTSTARLWPQTERIKASVARFSRAGDDAAATAAAQAFDALMQYCDTPVRGLWWDSREPEGRFRDEPAPASSLYHIALGLQELIIAAERQ